ncbi:MAG: hypothetical protein JO039_22200 [Solirubrobacterales bacterium]|nr:hypothetical protein [Solirubrobacterales bacterium]
MATFQTKDRESWFKRDLEANFEAYFRGLPNCPDIAQGVNGHRVLPTDGHEIPHWWP